jgi:carboxypeptidase D
LFPQVPFDLPIVAHDMLSRFLSTDYISAAGAAALVPSRIGNEEASIVGETHINGTALDASNPLSSDSDGLLENSSSSSSLSDTAKSPVADAYYNIGAALLVLLIVVAFGSCFIYRQRKRRRSIFSKGFSLGGTSNNNINNGQIDSPNGVGVGSPYSHRRHRSSGAHSASSSRRSGQHHGKGLGLETDENATSEETNELLPMHHKRQESNTLSHKGEQLFSVGEDDEEEEEEPYDSEEEGNLGKAGRKFSA